MNFPLYDTLFEEVKSKRDINKKQKTTFISNMSKLDKTGFEMVYLLICFYEVNNNDKSMSDYKLPYCGQYEGEDILFDLEKFPKKLKRMLLKFQVLHLKKMEEDKKMDEKKKLG